MIINDLTHTIFPKGRARLSQHHKTIQDMLTLYHMNGRPSAAIGFAYQVSTHLRYGKSAHPRKLIASDPQQKGFLRIIGHETWLHDPCTLFKHIEDMNLFVMLKSLLHEPYRSAITCNYYIIIYYTKMLVNLLSTTRSRNQRNPKTSQAIQRHSCSQQKPWQSRLPVSPAAWSA